MPHTDGILPRNRCELIMPRQRREKDDTEYTPEEAERRFHEAIRRAVTTPHKPLKEFIGTTDRARSMARQKARRRSRVK